MYELERLYEQLKYNTLKESYMIAANSITESSYNILEANQEIKDTMKSIEHESEKKMGKLLDKRKHGVITAKKLLSKYGATNGSKSIKPYGLTHEYKTFKTDKDIKKLHENAINYLNQFNPATASDTEVKLFISDIENNVQYKALCTIFGEGNVKCSTKDCVTTNKETREVTKQDVAEAFAYLENFDEDMSKYCITREAYDTYGMSKERKVAANYKTALMGIADSKYYDLMSEKLTLEFAQVAQLVTKASYHNPRDIRESKVINDYIDFLYEYTK